MQKTGSCFYAAQVGAEGALSGCLPRRPEFWRRLLCSGGHKEKAAAGVPTCLATAVGLSRIDVSACGCTIWPGDEYAYVRKFPALDWLPEALNKHDLIIRSP